MSTTQNRYSQKAAKLGKAQLNDWLARGGQQTLERYVADGRLFQNANTDDLVTLWKTATEVIAEDADHRMAGLALVEARAELALRRLQPPFD